MLFNKHEIFDKLNRLLENLKAEYAVDFLNEVAMVRKVRKGKIVRKVKVKRKGFKVVRQGSKVKFVRMTPQEKRRRRMAARRSWRKGKAARLVRRQRQFKKSKVRMKTLYGK
jgi:hypothetical protein